jgi:hypothetical protein
MSREHIDERTQQNVPKKGWLALVMGEQQLARQLLKTEAVYDTLCDMWRHGIVLSKCRSMHELEKYSAFPWLSLLERRKNDCLKSEPIISATLLTSRSVQRATSGSSLPDVTVERQHSSSV